MSATEKVSLERVYERTIERMSVYAHFQSTGGNMHSMSVCWYSNTFTASITRLQSLEIIFFLRMYERRSWRWRKTGVEIQICLTEDL